MVALEGELLGPIEVRFHERPTLYTLQHTPYALHPTPYTLHPTPYTLQLFPNTTAAGPERGRTESLPYQLPLTESRDVSWDGLIEW